MEKSLSRGNSSSVRRLPKELSAKLRAIAQSPVVQRISEALGPEADLYLVGGTVRDVLAGTEQADLDLATLIPPVEGMERLAAKEIRVVETGIEHGTILAVIDHIRVEITTFRTPGSRDQFLPSGSIEEDLAGRDFSINAMAFSTNRGKLIDPFGGLKDLRSNHVRAVGDAARRFIEDPLRMLRMVRFGSASGRTIDKKTAEAAKAHAKEISRVSVERIRDELEKIVMQKEPGKGIRALADLGFLEIVLPEALPSIGFEQNEFHTEDVFSHTLSVLERAPADRLVRLAALFHDFGKPHTLSTDEQGRRHFYLHEEVSERLCREAMERLHFSRDDTDAVALLVRTHMRPIECGPPGVRRLIRDLGSHFAEWRSLKRADKTPTMGESDFSVKLEAFDQLVEDEKNRPVGSPYHALAINGADLLALGMRQGPKIGDILKQLHEKVLDDPSLNTKEQLTSIVQVLLKQIGN